MVRQFEHEILKDPESSINGVYTGIFVKAPFSYFKGPEAPGAGGETSSEAFEKGEVTKETDFKFKPQYKGTFNLTPSQQGILLNFYTNYNPYNLNSVPGGIEWEFYKILVDLKAESDAAGVEYGIRFFWTYYEKYRAALDEQGNEIPYGTAFPDGTYRNGEIPLIVHTHPSGKGPSNEDLDISKAGGGLIPKQVFAAIGKYSIFYSDKIIAGVYNQDGTLYSKTWGKSGESGGESGSGQTEKEGEEADNVAVFLIDEMNNTHPLKRVNILWQNFTTFDGKKRLPKFFEKNAKGDILQEGSIVAIQYINSDYRKPLVIGCIESLGGQHNLDSSMNSDLDFVHNETDNNINDEFEVKRTVSESGSINIHIKNKNNKKIAYNLFLEGGEDTEISLGSNGNFFIENSSNSIQLIKDKIFVGAGEYKDKAKEFGVNAERIILGQSTFLTPFVNENERLFIDKGSNNQELNAGSSIDHFNAAQLNGKHQWAVLGHALIWLLRELVDIWGETKYQSGNTICQVSIEDKEKMKNRVRTKLPLMLSKVTSLIRNPGD